MFEETEATGEFLARDEVVEEGSEMAALRGFCEVGLDGLVLPAAAQERGDELCLGLGEPGSEAWEPGGVLVTIALSGIASIDPVTAVAFDVFVDAVDVELVGERIADGPVEGFFGEERALFWGELALVVAPERDGPQASKGSGLAA